MAAMKALFWGGLAVPVAQAARMCYDEAQFDPDAKMPPAQQGGPDGPPCGALAEGKLAGNPGFPLGEFEDIEQSQETCDALVDVKTQQGAGKERRKSTVKRWAANCCKDGKPLCADYLAPTCKDMSVFDSRATFVDRTGGTTPPGICPYWIYNMDYFVPSEETCAVVIDTAPTPNGKMTRAEIGEMIGPCCPGSESVCKPPFPTTTTTTIATTATTTDEDTSESGATTTAAAKGFVKKAPADDVANSCHSIAVFGFAWVAVAAAW